MKLAALILLLAAAAFGTTYFVAGPSGATADSVLMQAWSNTIFVTHAGPEDGPNMEGFYPWTTTEYRNATNRIVPNFGGWWGYSGTGGQPDGMWIGGSSVIGVYTAFSGTAHGTLTVTTPYPNRLTPRTLSADLAAGLLFWVMGALGREDGIVRDSSAVRAAFAGPAFTYTANWLGYPAFNTDAAQLATNTAPATPFHQATSGTIAIWATRSSSVATTVPMGWTGTNGFYGFKSGVSIGASRLGMYLGNTKVGEGPTPSVWVWHFYAITWDASRRTSFLDGVSNGVSAVGTWATQTNALLIGGATGQASWGAETGAYLRCVMGWNRCLTTAEVYQVYTETIR
jgi:hypothetical protein